MINELGQPIGDSVAEWSARPFPTASTLSGRYCRLERLADRHAEDLFIADKRDIRGESWTYLGYGPFADQRSYAAWVEAAAQESDPLFYAITDTDPQADPVSAGRAVGVLALLRVQPEAGSIEVGHVHYSPLLQRRRGGTEAQYLLMSYAFGELGYRRYEWKCDALNAPSRAAAIRLGFRYEGTFRQALVVKGRSRDTAWYSIIDSEWPLVEVRLRSWLAPENFDEHAVQMAPLTRSP